MSPTAQRRAARPNPADQTGYTLVEMMVVMSMLGVIMAGLVTLFVRTSNAEVDLNLRWQAQQNARLALDMMRREIHCASTVTTGPAAAPPGPLGASSITLALPSGCTGGGVAVTWCTRGSGDAWSLYRVAGSASCTGGTKYADGLTLPNIFGYTPPAAGSGELAKVGLDIPVDARPSRPDDTYELQDDIVLRNSARG